MRNHPQGISWMAWPLLVLGCFQVLSWHGLAHGFQIKPPWSLSSPTHGRRGSAPSMVEAVAYSDVTRAPPKVDAWALLVDAASGRKGPKNIKAPPPPEGFVNIVDYGPSGERGSRLRAGVLNAEMAQLSERLWGELRGELGYLKETDLADVRLALEISLYAHRGQVRERVRSTCVRGVDQLRGCSRATCLTGQRAVGFRGTHRCGGRASLSSSIRSRSRKS